MEHLDGIALREAREDLLGLALVDVHRLLAVAGRAGRRATNNMPSATRAMKQRLTPIVAFFLLRCSCRSIESISDRARRRRIDLAAEELVVALACANLQQEKGCRSNARNTWLLQIGVGAQKNNTRRRFLA